MNANCNGRIEPAAKLISGRREIFLHVRVLLHIALTVPVTHSSSCTLARPLPEVPFEKLDLPTEFLDLEMFEKARLGDARPNRTTESA